MADDERLTPAEPDDLQQALSFALRFSGRKRVLHGDEMMARIAAERIMEYLELSRFVVMKRPPGKPHGPTRKE